MIRTPYRHFEPDTLLADLMGNMAAMNGALQRFPAWLQTMETDLLSAAEADDAQRLARALHTLRGTLAQLHADPIVALATPLEHACKAAAADPATPAPGVAELAPLISMLKALAAEVTHYLAHY